MKKWLMTVLVAGGLAQAATVEEIARELRFTPRPEARLCQLLAQRYKNVTGYVVESPLALVRIDNLLSVTSQALIAGGAGMFAPYQKQEWESLGDGFWRLSIADSGGTGYRFWFDQVDRYRTEVCIQDRSQ